jgi:hypothetical protein
MSIFESLDRICFIHKQIKEEKTGKPEEFARLLNIKKRQLNNIIEEFKIRGANILYDRKNHTYYYENNFILEVKIEVKD